MQDLRKPFWDRILKIAKNDESVMVLVGDLGFSFFDDFKRELPNQIINCGIAECNMIGVSAGLAMSGYKPYLYSNSIFLISRAHEFVRDELCYNNNNVKLIGTGAAGFLGFSHNLGKDEKEEDWLKGFPNIIRHYPKDVVQLDKVLLKEHQRQGPAFIRL